MRASALLVLAACTASAPRAPLEHNVRRDPPVKGAPEITFSSMQLTATGLPAIAVDGTTVLFAVVDGDGGRGNPNMTVVLKERKDRELEVFTVVTANQSEGQYDERGPGERLAERIEAANTRLEELHGRYHFLPMTTEGVTAELGARVTIRAGDALVVDTLTPASWAVPDKKMCSSCAEVCQHPLTLGAAHANVEHRLVLLTIAYAGTDLCPEPVSQHHVITW